jgi:hypothetical protein
MTEGANLEEKKKKRKKKKKNAKVIIPSYLNKGLHAGPIEYLGTYDRSTIGINPVL